VEGAKQPGAGALATTLAYHERTKHFPGRFAPALGYLDWATQPDPFRRFAGTPLLSLELVPAGEGPGYHPAFYPGNIPTRPLDRRWVSQLLHDSLALSAWKQAGGARWSLRVNPSCGNLHPTEAYLVAGPIEGLADRAAVYHYAPHEHALERRGDLSEVAWRSLAAQLPSGGVLVGLTSIYWRESWKYGERGFRYCQHDVGHAIGALAVAAAGLGWHARLLEEVADPDLARLLGVDDQEGAEAEHPECLLALVPQDAAVRPIERPGGFRFPEAAREELGRTGWLGTPNRLSPDHHDWPVIDQIAAATRKLEPAPVGFWVAPSLPPTPAPLADDPALGLRKIIQQRRSAVALHGRSGITREAFFQILRKVLPAAGQIPFSSLPWRPRVDLLLFVHRVQGVGPGLYILLRDPARRETLRGLMTAGFAWTSPEGCPPELPLFLLESGDARRVAEHTSCGQEIAAAGVFAAAMLTDFRDPLETWGPWFYPRLFWETGVVGQQLYLEAEASGIRGTGIGCFFDDMTHRTFELADGRFQVLYHFIMGDPLEDARIQTVPPYQHLRAP
jgi:SagB-type dehydrogenase family enzyme